jgi:hypothetical protein
LRGAATGAILRRMEKTPNDVLADWFTPVLIGPFVGASSFATMKALLYLWQGGFGLWIVYMFFAVPLAAAQVIVFSAVDVGLLRAKLRALPTGREAWWMAVAAPMLVALLTGIFPKPQPAPAFFGLIVVLLALLPMVVITVAMRLVFGKAP